jgi:hypothetical protein
VAISINRKSAIRNPKSSCPRTCHCEAEGRGNLHQSQICNPQSEIFLPPPRISFIISFSANIGLARPEYIEGPAMSFVEGLRLFVVASKKIERLLLSVLIG